MSSSEDEHCNCSVKQRGDYTHNCDFSYCRYCGENMDAGNCVCFYCEICGENIDVGKCNCFYCEICGKNIDADDCKCVVNWADRHPDKQTARLLEEFWSNGGKRLPSIPGGLFRRYL